MINNELKRELETNDLLLDTQFELNKKAEKLINETSSMINECKKLLSSLNF